MGLLDSFNLEDPKTIGLLAAASNMLQASGPSNTPTSLGQVFGGGMQAYTGSLAASKKQKMEEDQAKQMAMLRGLQIQEAQGGLQDHALARQQAESLRQFYLNQRTGNPAPPEIKMPAGMGGNLAPTNENATRLETMQPTPVPTSEPAQASDPYSQRMALSQQLRSQGFHNEADAQEKAALSFKPKFKDAPQVVSGPDGKPMLVQMADDGTVRPIQGGYGVAEKLAFHNLGGQTVGLDPYTGKASATFKNTQSPDSLASNGLGYARLNFEKLQESKPKFNNEVGAFITPPSKLNPNGTLTNLDGYTKPEKALTESQGKATTFAARMKDAESIISSMEKKGVSGSDFGTIAAGSPYSNWAATPNGQQYRQAQENWVTANLRQESGAAIGVDEMAKDVRKYFPVPGDSDEVKAQKSNARKVATQGMVVQAGPGSKSIDSIVGAGQSGGQQKTATLADITATAKASGKTTAQITAALKAKGYTIGGQ